MPVTVTVSAYTSTIVLSREFHALTGSMPVRLLVFMVREREASRLKLNMLLSSASRVTLRDCARLLAEAETAGASGSWLLKPDTDVMRNVLRLGDVDSPHRPPSRIP